MDTNSNFLSRKDRLQSLSSYLRHIFLNGIGFCCLTGTIIYLLAINLGASNTELGYISSTLYITGGVILLVPVLFGGMKLIKVFWLLWLIRGASCFAYLAAGFIHSTHPALAVWLLLIGYTLFASLRNMAWPMKQTVEKILVSPNQAGKQVAKFNQVLNYSKLLSSVISFAILSIAWLDGNPGLMVLIIIGIILNMLSAFSLRSIPLEERIEPRKKNAIFTAGKSLYKNRDTFVVVMLYWGVITFNILVGFIIPYMKKLVKMPVNVIFGYTILAAIASIIAAKLVTIFADRIGSKPLLNITFLLNTCIALVWVFLSPASHWSIIMALACITTALQILYTLLVARLLIKVIPQESKVGFTSMLNFFAAIIALFAGISMGKTADMGLNVTLHLPHIYSPAFLVMTLVSAIMFILCLVLNESSSLSLNETGKMFLSSTNLKTFLMIDKLDSVSNPLKEKQIMLKLTNSASDLATNEIKKRLKNPLIRKKEELIRSLFFHYRPELLDEILNEASDPDSWWRETAIFTLGAYPDPKTESLLLDIFNNETYPYLRSIAAKSLARVGNHTILPELLDMLYNRPNLNVRTTLNMVTAIGIMDKERKILADMFKIATMRDSEKYRQHVYIILSRRIGFTPGIERFFTLENQTPEAGFNDLIEEVTEQPYFSSYVNSYLEAYKAGDYGKIAEMCASCARQIGVDRSSVSLPFLKRGIERSVKYHLKNVDAIALVYFTFALVKYKAENKKVVDSFFY